MKPSQHVYITGIASGIGLALARLYADQGARVGGCAIESVSQARKRLPAGIDYVQADVCNPVAMQAAIEAFAHGAGADHPPRLDLLIACAGISMPKASFPDFDRGRKVIEVNVLGLLNSFDPALEIMRTQGHGHLVALGSFAGIVGLPGMACYGASKAAVLSLCESMAGDLAEHGIHVTAVAPGFVDTPLTRDNPHRMPFKLSAEQTAALIASAIRRKKTRITIPWPMAVLAGLLYHLPRRAYLALMRRDPLNLRS